MTFGIAKIKPGAKFEHRSRSPELMTSPPSGDEGMYIIARNSQSRFLQSAVTNPELQPATDATPQHRFYLACSLRRLAAMLWNEQVRDGEAPSPAREGACAPQAGARAGELLS
jgi:hypothetical protein